ncbi:type II secretory pathway, component PulD [Oleiharenicola lentus]|uniref:type II secretory pathway, component PulD n=1 Tax=Oleiharenicola lentus TaxID=2508720 RepID=UPI003F67BDE5
MNRNARYFTLTVGLAASLAVAGFARLQAEPDVAETKIRLLSDALLARDSGDIERARKNLQQLLAITPNDETVKRLLASLDRLPQPTVTVSGAIVSTSPASEVSEVDELARAEEQRLNALIEAASVAAREARALEKDQRFSQALATVERAASALPENNLTQPAAAELTAVKAEILIAQEKHLASSERAAPPSVITPSTTSVPGVATSVQTPPAASASSEVAGLVVRGRSQYLAGDSAAALETFERVTAVEPAHSDALYFIERIQREQVTAASDRERTSARMIGEVNSAWQRPGVFTERTPGAAVVAGPSPFLEKLNSIVLPSVNFSGMELSRVVNTLSVISEEFDNSGSTPKGVNVVLLDPTGTNPTVNITLRNLPLKRVLDFITDSVGYQYEVQADAVVVRPGGEQSAMDTQFFAISRSTVLRMSGKGGASGASTVDPLTGATTSANSADVAKEGQDIRTFLQLAGVNFDDVKGSSLAFDGSQLIATQTPRNLERIRNILNRYNDVRQVEIEAKFMEVQQGALDEIGVQWNVRNQRATSSQAYSTGDGVNRALRDAFRSSGTTSSGSIVRPDEPGLPIVNTPPLIPGTNNIGLGAGALGNIVGAIGQFDVNAVVRALSQKTGTELLSAPKLTVLSGNAATITVAQELRYPQSYGQVQSQVGTGSASGGGSAGVAITAGTPQEFATRNVGVELKVTPTVEEDDYSISLDLNPKVTEFEGFVEYGGQSIAISGSTTVTVPSGFYQPIFGVREMNTKVTIWDGATLVMGGLTREDVKKVNDKVPVLGSLPGIGRLFRSQGESTQKRNLLIFVTANLVSPGGSLKKQSVQGVAPGTLYQNPTIVTPEGSAPRGK